MAAWGAPAPVWEPAAAHAWPRLPWCMERARRANGRLGVARFLRPVDQAPEALGLEVDRLARGRQTPSPFVQLVVVRVDSYWMAHT